MAATDVTIPPGAGSLLVIDLAAIAANYKLIRDTAKGVRVGASVKADAYGLGVGEVAPALAAAGCDTFFVAGIREGATLRSYLPHQRIVVLNGPEAGSGALFRDHNLTPAINGMAQLALWRDLASGEAGGGAAGIAEPPEIVLHLDTGMSRLGFTPEEAAALAANPSPLDGMKVVTVLSHLACADEPASPMNAQQRDAFIAACDALAPAIGNPERSLANSSGAFLGPDFHFDMVRPGAALYGINPRPGEPNKMRQAIQLFGKILQVRDVDSPQTVGYGAAHHVDRASRVATVATGYADGYLRRAGRLDAQDGRPLATAYIGDTAVPVIGRVSMDLITIDVSAIARDAVAPGMPVELLGARFTPDDLGECAGTIGYEVLTRLGPRHHRVYRSGAA